MINFWETVQLPNPVPDNYREMVAINSIPLFETQKIPEYTELAQDMMKSQTSDVWVNAMRHVPRGFTQGDDTIEKNFTVELENGFVTNTWNLRNNEHYTTYQNLTGNTINRFNRIVELGGGCGDMCRFIRDMGYDGEYVIWDLPMTSRIQQVALSDVDVYFTNHVPKPVPRTLFIATWSLSETTLDFRENLVKKLDPKNYLICYQHEFEGIDNSEYFSTWQGSQPLLPDNLDRPDGKDGRTVVMYDKKSSYICQ